MYKKLLLAVICMSAYQFLFAQSGYWQQSVNYVMDIEMDVKKNQFEGNQKLTYTNNSPDTLDRVFYHLYFNAFQPGSVMDERNKVLPDADRRVAGRIGKLGRKEIGYQKIEQLTMDGKKAEFFVNGTVLEVDLPKSIYPGQTVVFDMDFEAQVPIQIRRSGRDNKEGVRYSMAQWYPKIAEYDYMGWHPNPYVGREFHSPWGDFEVNITIDKDYVLGATGVLQNANQIGKGYQPVDLKVAPPKGKTLTWKFKAENVIDFVWAADPDFIVMNRKAHDGTHLYFVFQPGEATSENWSKLPKIMDEALRFMNSRYGAYPFPQYSFIQGGDGGMEYPMATLITGERSLGSLVGVSVHEWMHSWYQFMLATNESLYSWMDEGFTSFGTNETMNYLVENEILPGKARDNVHARSYLGYINLANAKQDEALSTHADHFNTNAAYGTAAYSKGCVFLSQMEYILGEEVFADALLRYYNDWRFKHPTSLDFMRVMEKESGLVLDWYHEYFVQTTKTIDYGVVAVERGGLFGKADIVLERTGLMPMPLDVQVTLEDGSEMIYHIPLDIMRGAKKSDTGLYGDAEYVVLDDWNWVNPKYMMKIKPSKKKIAKIEINPSGKLADVNPENDTYTKD